MSTTALDDPKAARLNGPVLRHYYQHPILSTPHENAADDFKDFKDAGRGSPHISAYQFPHRAFSRLQSASWPHLIVQTFSIRLTPDLFGLGVGLFFVPYGVSAVLSSLRQDDFLQDRLLRQRYRVPVWTDGAGLDSQNSFQSASALMAVASAVCICRADPPPAAARLGAATGRRFGTARGAAGCGTAAASRGTSAAAS